MTPLSHELRRGHNNFYGIKGGEIKTHKKKMGPNYWIDIIAKKTNHTEVRVTTSGIWDVVIPVRRETKTIV